ncbi:Concanavalin A-like lectin/glucanases superfamily [Penicillium bovifimosum]|uniref:Concanavalin A-like lectin/glucanases superfamily n=1 Tax=Penicillium bovifimosum TaxID=126998 RepID=A0A9W9GJE0_9EURO|nr:Concanavalin A-like lectin/glucanases superfamily [Penicillium bovifimosum]KAJ5120944.1 Concanavalin A-like lectin/glucanases superfamily [Penicillium bovifimosum]
MKSPARIIGVALLIASVIAVPLKEFQTRHEIRRSAGKERRTSRPYIPGTSDVLHPNGTSQKTYSSNWAGAVLIGTGYISVSADFTVPVPRSPKSADPNTNYCASAWVGIDGDTCNTAILQTGVAFCIQGGTASYDAWYEWYPDYAHDFSPNIRISAGNVVRVAVNATSKSSGTATIENLSTGEYVSHIFPNALGGDLCEYNAEWIVEDFTVNNAMAPFADFGTVAFTNAEASDGTHTYGPSNATVMDIYQGQVLTSSSVTERGVIVSYT